MKIPRAVSILAHGKPYEINKLLIAAILSSEEEMLHITDSQLRAAESYKLITTIGEDGSVTLIAEPK